MRYSILAIVFFFALNGSAVGQIFDRLCQTPGQLDCWHPGPHYQIPNFPGSTTKEAELDNRKRCKRFASYRSLSEDALKFAIVNCKEVILYPQRLDWEAK